jgi:hypothetical protein
MLKGVKQFEKYNNRCDVIKSLILTNYINDKFEFIRRPDTLYIEVIINNDYMITLGNCDTWKQIKRRIDKNLIYVNNEECPICYNELKKKDLCNKCANNWCRECYINIF